MVNGVAECQNGYYTMGPLVNGPLVNGAKTAKHVSELGAQRFTIPILKCFVDFCGIFYVVKMSFLYLQTNVFLEIWHRAFF